jgi:hypothetical protein
MEVPSKNKTEQQVKPIENVFFLFQKQIPTSSANKVIVDLIRKSVIFSFFNFTVDYIFLCTSLIITGFVTVPSFIVFSITLKKSFFVFIL